MNFDDCYCELVFTKEDIVKNQFLLAQKLSDGIIVTLFLDVCHMTLLFPILQPQRDVGFRVPSPLPSCKVRLTLAAPLSFFLSPSFCLVLFPNFGFL